MTEPITIPITTHRWRTLLYALICTGFTVGGVLIATRHAEMDDPQTAQWIGWAAAALFGTFALIGLYASIRPRLMLTLTEQGIAFPKGTLVHWRDIEGFSTGRISHNKAIFIGFHDAQEWLTRNPERKWQMNYSMYGTPVLFQTGLLGVKAESFAVLLESLRQEYGVSDV